ncbi:MAG: HEPN domain-containing protein [Magnetococcales bacterium]|nr:HEPN domain-containing protein [Magnetococcales bacterium]
MSPIKTLSGVPQDWINRAKGDLALARVPLPEEGYFEDLCLHAQQAAEKAIKAIFCHRGYRFSYTHDLEILLTELKNKGEEIPDKIFLATHLTPFAGEMRYPFMGDPITQEEYQEILQHAEAVVAWAKAIVLP